jgi:ribose-phosphate pyrophosphokinase
MKLAKPLVVSPDTGGVKTAYSYSQMLGTGLAIVAKQRLGAAEVDAFSVVGDVEGCDVIMVDDMTTTCGTLCAAAKLLKSKGAKSVRAVVSHIPLTQVGIDRLRNNNGLIEELITTDSIPLGDKEAGLPVHVLSVAPLLAEAIIRIHNNQSVSSLFRLS